MENYLQSITFELSNETRVFKFQPFYDLVEPFEVDLYPDFSAFSEIIVEIQAFSCLYQSLNLSISTSMDMNDRLIALN